MDALNAVKGVHPFVGRAYAHPLSMRAVCGSDNIPSSYVVAVTAFEVLLTLEMKRRENDKRVSGILLKQADMMMALLQSASFPCSRSTYLVLMRSGDFSLTPHLRCFTFADWIMSKMWI